MHLGNYLGAVRNWVALQDKHQCIYCVVDLHALTTAPNPADLRANTLTTAGLLMSAGIRPNDSTLFAQSTVGEHAELAWMMECTVGFGELRRMTQFKDKSDRTEFISAGLFTYPALQASDILLYDTELVPVGEDQRQHIELCRDIAERFNNRYGETLAVPSHMIPKAGARIMDLQNPQDKMSKSLDSPGTIGLTEDNTSIARKFKRAVTDSDGEVRYDPAAKPGVSNLLGILAAATNRTPEAVGEDYSQYGALKTDTADAVIDLLAPIRQSYAEFMSDPAEITHLLAIGADKARVVASATLQRAKDNAGLIPHNNSYNNSNC
ncbi:MAG: tryptophan--tRNA ligase [Acidimicrobiia bacterium]|nr:tryptophan--tRNA ligase [Acidimicrobiia bacterium]MYC58430.1 tryptophan--tRNA ligase [Acidimicrobiia bacterium]MYI30464.1 tryptophan--tRNA ligase [Acidimicrobiia bacterium]